MTHQFYTSLVYERKKNLNDKTKNSFSSNLIEIFVDFDYIKMQPKEKNF
jgi:hypothetical protein